MTKIFINELLIKRETKKPLYFYKIIINKIYENYLSCKTFMPGNSIPSKNSNEAPPPVDI